MLSCCCRVGCAEPNDSRVANNVQFGRCWLGIQLLTHSSGPDNVGPSSRSAVPQCLDHWNRKAVISGLCTLHNAGAHLPYDPSKVCGSMV